CEFAGGGITELSVGTTGQPAPLRRGDGRLRKSPWRRNGGRRHALCPGRLCGGGLADCRSIAEDGHAHTRIRSEYLGTGCGREKYCSGTVAEPGAGWPENAW